MDLKYIYRPIEKGLVKVDNLLNESLKRTKYKSILELNNYLLDSKGKRIRPALVMICAKVCGDISLTTVLTKIASAIELIHTASLVHDDIIDQSALRHYKPTFNKQFGEDVSIAFGDYLYAVAFELIASCNNTDILSCIAQASRALCEGELIQVCERDNLSLLKERYLLIVKKKTASLFAASCQVGAILAQSRQVTQDALKGYGLNLGVAFQIVDDCRDLTGSKEKLGKSPGLDFKAGELTLPILNLISQEPGEKKSIIALLKNQGDERAFRNLSQKFLNSSALERTKKDAFLYIRKAKNFLNSLEDSSCRRSLSALADYVAGKADFDHE
ncbi:MAG: polyprenyl synthetase family protein [Candidatus Omnitrophota bacterium]|nr:polyprenyl synthetase family protein [Candidatus Omnitrophota bacterium]